MNRFVALAKGVFPVSFKPAVRDAYFDLVDLADVVLKRRKALMPPRRLIYKVGAANFTEIGEEFLRHFIELGRLEPGERVLDVGCGPGRMAVCLTGFLSSQGEYWGFDIANDAIEWCQRHISTRFPNFHFQFSDIYNGSYNPGGKYQALEYEFPYEDGYFDFVFLTSVFTHMLPEDLEHYLSEVSRVLRPGGRCMSTFFLLNGESTRLIRAGSSNVDFRHELGGYRVSDAKHPEGAVGYEESRVWELLARHGLSIIEPIHYGSWCGRSKYKSYQDIIVSTKENTHDTRSAPHRAWSVDSRETDG